MWTWVQIPRTHMGNCVAAFVPLTPVLWCQRQEDHWGLPAASLSQESNVERNREDTWYFIGPCMGTGTDSSTHLHTQTHTQIRIINTIVKIMVPKLQKWHIPYVWGNSVETCRGGKRALPHTQFSLLSGPSPTYNRLALWMSMTWSIVLHTRFCDSQTFTKYTCLYMGRSNGGFTRNKNVLHTIL